MKKTDKIIRVFPRRTKWTPNDDLVFIGEPPIIGKPSKEYPVFVSCTFTWDMKESERLYRSWSAEYPNVFLGGPAFGDVGDSFTPGQFIKPGVVITSRGCPKNCPWCFVPEREGGIKELPITEGYIVQDNNLLACSDNHVAKVFEMLKRQKVGIDFRGGIDAELLTEYHVDMLQTIKVDRMFLSYDHMGKPYDLEKASELLSDYSRDQKRCYVLCNFYDNDTVSKAEKRLLKVWELGFMPFSMYYRNGNMTADFKSKDWADLVRIFSRPAIMRGYCHKETHKGE